MKRALLVIDVQNYFMNSLTKDLPRNIRRYIEKKKKIFDSIIFTNFVNTHESSVYRFLHWKESMTPPETDIVSELKPVLKYGILVSKNTLSALKDRAIQRLLKQKNIEELYLCGIDTDCCVLATAFDAFDQGYKVYLIKKLSMSYGDKSLHEAAASIFKRNLGTVT